MRQEPTVRKVTTMFYPCFYRERNLFGSRSHKPAASLLLIPEVFDTKLGGKL